MGRLITTIGLPLLLLSSSAWAEETISPPPPADAAATRASIYHTPRERREAGLGTKLTDWLMFSGLIEVEATSYYLQFRNEAPNAGRDDSVSTVQLGFDVQLSDHIKSEMVLEFEDEKTDSNIDEAFIELEAGDWGVAVGRQGLPFGVYYSHFITGPMLEFGETVENGLLLDYDYDDTIEVASFIFDGAGTERDADERIRDWGAAVETSFINNRLAFGASYLSDLASTDDRLLSDFDDRYRRRVGAWSAFVAVRPGRWELTAETVQALRAFAELDENADQPRAWNVEVAYYPRDTWELAARLESSDELADEPERQYGIAATWLTSRALSVSLEYLRADYRARFAFDDNDNELQHRQLYAARLSLEF